MYGTLTDFEPLELQFDLFLVRRKVPRVSLKPSNSSIKPITWKRIRIKNDFFCSAIGSFFCSNKSSILRLSVGKKVISFVLLLANLGMKQDEKFMHSILNERLKSFKSSLALTFGRVIEMPNV